MDFLTDQSRMLASLHSAEQDAAARRNAGLRDVARYPEAWLRFYADDVAEMVLTVSDDEGILALSHAAAGSLDPAVERAVLRLAERPDVRSLTGTLRLMTVDEKGLGRAARRGLGSIWEDPERTPTRDRLVALLPTGWEPFLEQFEASLGKGRRARAVVRGTRRILDTKGRD
jgi:hypothetical protein